MYNRENSLNDNSVINREKGHYYADKTIMDMDMNVFTNKKLDPSKIIEYLDTLSTAFKTISYLTISDTGSPRYYNRLPCYGSFIGTITENNHRNGMFISIKKLSGIENLLFAKEYFLNETKSPVRSMLKLIYEELGTFKNWDDFVDFCINYGIILPEKLLKTYSKAAIMFLGIGYRQCFGWDNGSMHDDTLNILYRNLYPEIPEYFKYWFIFNVVHVRQGIFHFGAFKDMKKDFSYDIPSINSSAKNSQEAQNTLIDFNKVDYWNSTGLPVQSYFYESNLANNNSWGQEALDVLGSDWVKVKIDKYNGRKYYSRERTPEPSDIKFFWKKYSEYYKLEGAA